MASKVKRSKPYDAASYLTSDEAVAEYITAALDTGDIELISHAIGIAAKARGMSKIAEETGLSRESLYRALSAEGRRLFKKLTATWQGLNEAMERLLTEGERK